MFEWYFKENQFNVNQDNSILISDLLQDYCQQNEIHFYNLLPPLITYAKVNTNSDNKLLYWNDDTHFSDVGHEFIAKFLANLWNNI